MKPDTIKSALISPLPFILLFLCTLPDNIFAQENDLSYAYYNATNLYNTGKIDSAYSILSESLKNKQLYKKTSKNTKASIYRLTALSSILLENHDNARYYVKRMLACRPYYRDNFREGDLLEFRSLVEEYTVLPRVVIGAGVFTDYSKISLEKNLTSHTEAYIPKISDITEYGGGFSIEDALTKRLSVGIGINLFRVSFSYEGAIIPLSADNVFDLKFRYIETPVYLNYKFRFEKKLKPYLQLGIIGRYYPKQKDKYNVPHRYKSSEYGTYYMQQENTDGYNGVLAVFFQNYEYFDLLAGGGINYTFKSSCIDLNAGCAPLRINTNPLQDISNTGQIPETELFASADETIVVDIKRILRFTLSYKLFLNYKAF